MSYITVCETYDEITGNLTDCSVVSVIELANDSLFALPPDYFPNVYIAVGYYLIMGLGFGAVVALIKKGK